MTDTVTPEIEPQPRRRMPKRTVLAVAAGSVAIALGVGGFLTTTAAFTDRGVVAGNSVSTATLQLGQRIAHPMSVSNLAPGAEVTNYDLLRFGNFGTVGLTYTITLDNVTGPAALLAWVPVTITAGGQTASGTLAAPPKIIGSAAAVSSPATDIGVDVTVGLDSEADDSVQSKSASFDLVVNATQK